MSEAEAFGMCMPEIDAERLAKKDFITRGGEGEVWKGEYEGHGPVAIKVVPMVGQMGKRDRTQVLHTYGHVVMPSLWLFFVVNTDLSTVY